MHELVSMFLLLILLCKAKKQLTSLTCKGSLHMTIFIFFFRPKIEKDIVMYKDIPQVNFFFFFFFFFFVCVCVCVCVCVRERERERERERLKIVC
jgi:hypothetical protein